MRKRPLLAVTMLLGLSFAAGFAHADADLQQFVQQSLNEARGKANLPAMAALVQINGKIEAQAAVGVRAVGQSEKVTLDDRWHLGSDTKAMTATMIARLVEQGVLDFDDTLAILFPGIAARMNPAFSNVTLAQLLSHTSGLTPLTELKELAIFNSVIESEKYIRGKRAAVAAYYLMRKPVSKAGEFSYSNLGYVIAAAAAEGRTGESWEDLIRREVWKPLGIRNAGFGAPGKSGKFDEPLGHEMRNGQMVAIDPGDAESDNPPALGPAGTVNITLKDWLLFAQDQLDGEHGHGKLLKPETYKKLHTAITKNYAMGWGVLLDNKGAVSILTHTGSNGYWVADLRIMPLHDMIVLAVTNAGGDEAEAAMKDLGKTFRARLKPFE
jgi:CubicO group peptidase (beta-lactamase class C family)